MIQQFVLPKFVYIQTFYKDKLVDNSFFENNPQIHPLYPSQRVVQSLRASILNSMNEGEQCTIYITENSIRVSK